MKYNTAILPVPVKGQISADALSCAPSRIPEASDIQFIEEVQTFANCAISSLLATAQHLKEIRNAQKSEEECCQDGWPLYMPQQPLLRLYWKHRAYLAVVDDLLLYDECIVIPRVLRLEVLDCTHRSRLGINKCCARACMSVWWPGLSGAIKDLIKSCFTPNHAFLLPQSSLGGSKHRSV